jgi:hypothetical protein
MRRLLLTVLLALGLVLPVGSTAEAHSFGAQGPPHTHLSNPGCTAYDCWRWILVNGAILQGPAFHLAGEMPLVLVVCSQRVSGPGGAQIWVWNNEHLGSSGQAGYAHPYCQLPAYSGTPWSVRP